MRKVPTIPRIKDYAKFAGKAWVKKIKDMAKPLKDKRVVHINATAYGGGVAAMLNSTSLLMNDLGIETGWRVLIGTHSFFKATRKMLDGLQGKKEELTETDLKVYKDYNIRNTIINHLRYHDLVFVHDPQPLSMIQYYKEKKCAWIWRCHSDLSKPYPPIANFLKPLINKYQSAIFHMKEYVLPGLKIPTKIMPPGYDPMGPKNIELSQKTCHNLLEKHGIPLDKPFILHVSRFDSWKNQKDSIATYRAVERKMPCRLVMIGDMATDDPEGPRIYSEIEAQVKGDPDVIVLTERNDFLVNALQKCAAAVLQPSLREGFGLVVGEAMLKGTPVIARPVGGIPLQVINNKTGYLVNTPEQAAKKCMQLIKNPHLRDKLGEAGRKHILKNFLITKELEEYIRIIPKYCPIK